MVNKNLLIASIFFLFLFRCSSESECENYPYANNIIKYINESTSVTLDDSKKIIYILNLNSCDNCVDVNTQLLLKLPSDLNLVVIFVSKSYDPIIQNRVKTISEKFKTSFDEEKLIETYETGFSKPIIIQISKNKCYNYFKINDNQIDLVEKKMTDWLL